MTTDCFVSDTGVIVPAITTNQMREVDRVAIEELGPNLYQMMENAGRNLALMVMDVLGSDWSSTPITVLAGTGGNGGGGICAARHLANRGADVALVVSEPTRLRSVPKQQLDIYRSTSGKVTEVADLETLRPGLIVDAVIGYSLSNAPRGAAAQIIEWLTSRRAHVISLDVPSGIDSTTGAAPGAHVRASTTLTLALPKTALDASEVGDLWLADIGIPGEVYKRLGIDVPPAVFANRFRVPIQPYP